MARLELVACLLLTGTIVSSGNTGRSGFKPHGSISDASAIRAGIPVARAGLLSSAIESEVLPRFNAAREEYGAPLIAAMDPELTAKALAAANQLIKRHLVDSADVDIPSNRDVLYDESSLALQYFQFGEVGVTNERYVARYAVGKWLGEQATFESAVPSERRYKRETRHFTQIIWKDLTSVGCACSDEPDSVSQQIMFLCYFNPSGNVQHGENNVAFRANIGKRIA